MNSQPSPASHLHEAGGEASGCAPHAAGSTHGRACLLLGAAVGGRLKRGGAKAAPAIPDLEPCTERHMEG